MSIDAGLFVRLEPNGENWKVPLLRALIECGWRMDDHGRVVVLPLGDDDDYDWTAMDKSQDVWELLSQKSEKGEPLGVVLSWKGTGIGGNCMLRGNELEFSAQLNRRCIDGTDVTDVSWYLERLVVAIAQSGVRVSSWEWVENA